MHFAELVEETIDVLESGLKVLEAYPLLRQIEDKRVEQFGKSSWPGMLFRLRDSGQFEVATSQPHLDQFFQGRFSESDITEQDENELRHHLLRVLKSWLRESKRCQKIVDNASAKPKPHSLQETQKQVAVKDDSKHPTEQQIRDLYNGMKKRFTVMKEGRDRQYKGKAKANGHGFDDIGFYRTDDSWVAYEKKTPRKIVWYSLKPSDVKKLKSFFPANTLKK